VHTQSRGELYEEDKGERIHAVRTAVQGDAPSMRRVIELRDPHEWLRACRMARN
jgi:hypothetical protein